MNFIQRLGDEILGKKPMDPNQQPPVDPQQPPVAPVDPNMPQQPVAPAVDPNIPVAPQPPVDPTPAPEAPQPAQTRGRKAQDTTRPKQEDRSAFNCPDCGGEGLKDGNNQFANCPRCGGTGKV